MKKIIFFFKYSTVCKKLVSIFLISVFIIGSASDLISLYITNTETKKILHIFTIPLVGIIIIMGMSAGLFIWYKSKNEKNSEIRAFMKFAAFFVTLPIGAFIAQMIIYPLLGNISYHGLINIIPDALFSVLYIMVFSWVIQKPVEYIRSI
ncbi:MAG: hypothetical protein WCQ32_03600 [bacterium]